MKKLSDVLEMPKRVGSYTPKPGVPVCPTCDGPGVLSYGIRDITDPRFGQVYPCPACLADRYEPYLPVGSRQRLRFSTWQQRPQLKAAYDAARKFAAGKASHPFLTLSGSYGTGKTHLALAIVWDWLEAGRLVQFTQAERFLDGIRRGFGREEDDSGYWLIQRAMSGPLFVLDDLGAHQQTDWATAKLDEIVNERYVNRRPMVVTTNDASKLPARIQDRLLEGVCVEMASASWRRQ